MNARGGPSLPTWLKALHVVDRQVTRGYQIYQVVRDELFFAFTTPSHRTRLTMLAYGAVQGVYGPGGRHFDPGLFAWEESSLDSMKIGPKSRVLIGGIGGGRELPALAQRAGEVVAFEPSRELFEQACRVAEPFDNTTVYQGTYEEFVSAVRERRGPLVAAIGPHDAIILGRGSFAHITDEAEQRALLGALRSSSPHAPVLMSFAVRPARKYQRSPSTQVRDEVRRILVRFGGRSVGPGLRYVSQRGFVYDFTEDEIRALSEGAGYRVDEFGSSPYALRVAGRPPAHAILVPKAVEPFG
jgi:hypothetical protein